MINFDKISEIYGNDVLILVKENVEDVIKNFQYLINLDFNDVEDIFERYVTIFICSQKEFKTKVDKLINKLGIEYVGILESNMELWEELA